MAEKEYNRRFFKQLGLQVQQQEERLIFKFLKTASLFFFNFKKFHLHTYNQQKYLFYLVFWIEILAWIWVVWFLLLLILPNASITLKVAQQTENIIYNFRYYPAHEKAYQEVIKQLSIPYYTGSIDYQYTLAISTENIQHIVNPSAGIVKVYNKTENEINLKPETRFVTSDGLVFATREMLTIPAGTAEFPSEIRVKLFAAENDENGVIIGTRGNILKKTVLTIKNIKESYYLKNIRAEAIEDFTGGSKTSIGMVSEKDQELLKEKLQMGVYKDKLNIVQREFKEKKALIMLFDPLVKTQFHELKIDGNVWEKATSLKGSAKVSFSFLYLKWDDVLKAFSDYVLQRQSDSIQLISIDPMSFGFLSDVNKFDEQVFAIPTKVTILQGYDFKRDIKGIQSTIKTMVAGMGVEEARKFILTYPEIASTKISLGLLGGSTLPTLKSRIKIIVEL